MENSAATLTCSLPSDPNATELVWWDAPADSAVNDLATVATTQDATNLYWAAELHVDPDPATIPFAEIAINVVSATSTGTQVWWDPGARVAEPGHCSASTTRLCTTDIDCHFCAQSTNYTGTANERPRPCGTTFTGDLCTALTPADFCDRTETCVGSPGALAQGVGQMSTGSVEADYLLVFDFSRWLVGQANAVQLKRANGAGGWVDVPGGLFLPFVDPGTSGGSGGPPGKIELLIPWSSFSCAGCETFGPGDEFQWTLAVVRGVVAIPLGGQDYAPDGPIEDVMSESVAGTTTTTTDSCAQVPAEDQTLCEIADASADAYVPLSSAAGGRSSQLTMVRNTTTATPSVTLNWGASCSPLDTHYSVQEGTIGNFYSHTLVPGECDLLALTTTFNASTGDRYYLVVPSNMVIDGSYGENSMGAERPVGTAECHLQVLGNCP